MMPSAHKELYDGLMRLVETREAFLKNDQKRDDHLFRIFSYRIPTYSDFCEPYALDTRGTMFELDASTGEPLRLAARPFEKFFGLNENPMTTGLDLSLAKHIYVKEDGSLISTYRIGDKLCLKSKASLRSEQAMDAESFLNEASSERIKTLRNLLYVLSSKNYTVNLEWVSPKNRIVLGYDEPNLVILSIRSLHNGKYFYPKDFAIRELLESYWVKDWYDPDHAQQLITEIPTMEGREGFVIVLNDETKIKVKTEWYLTRHRMKDSVQHPRHLFEAVIREATDDLKMLFAADPVTLDIIQKAEQEFLPKYNHMIATVTKFHDENKMLSRKDYAIKATALKDGLMPLYMDIFLGRLQPHGFTEFAVKNPDLFGVKPMVPYQASQGEPE